MTVSHKIRSFILTMGLASVLVTTAAFVLGTSDSSAAMLPTNSIVGQLPVEDPVLIFSGAKFALALVVGVIMAFVTGRCYEGNANGNGRG